MRVFRWSCAGILAVLLVGCAREPTTVALPPGATSVERFPLAIRGGAFQTQFALQASYPATPALDFYRTHMASGWMLCEWSGAEWEHFVAKYDRKPSSVHQQLYMWVNREAGRTMMLSMRYYSAAGSDDVPDNDRQEIVLVENLAPDVAATIRALDLRCPN